MQNLQLSSEGKSFSSIATNFDQYFKEIALNRHLDDGNSEEVTESIDLAVEIWDKFEKGEKDNRLEIFLENHVERLGRKSFEVPHELAMIFMKGMQHKKSLESNSDFVKSLINNGEIPLARSFKDWNTEIEKRSKNRKQFSIHYLRNLFPALHFTKHDLPFVFQKTLFKPPNEKSVAVFVPKKGENKYSDKIILGFFL